MLLLMESRDETAPMDSKLDHGNGSSLSPQLCLYCRPCIGSRPLSSPFLSSTPGSASSTLPLTILQIGFQCSARFFSSMSVQYHAGILLTSSAGIARELIHLLEFDLVYHHRWHRCLAGLSPVF